MFHVYCICIIPLLMSDECHYLHSISFHIADLLIIYASDLTQIVFLLPNGENNRESQKVSPHRRREEK